MGRRALRRFKDLTRVDKRKILFAHNSGSITKPSLLARFEINERTFREILKEEDSLLSVDGPWKLSHNGLTWEDMPGHDTISKRCNFALYRRGRIDPFKADFKNRRGARKTTPENDQEEVADDIAVFLEEE